VPNSPATTKMSALLFLVLPGNVRAEIGMARTEVYEKVGKPPVVAPASIQEDLRRRDFTVNAMALSLNEGSRGLLLDPFNGVADIEAKVLRVLNNYAFVEDPSRMIRATRFAARFHWPLEEKPSNASTLPGKIITSNTSRKARSDTRSLNLPTKMIR